MLKHSVMLKFNNVEMLKSLWKMLKSACRGQLCKLAKLPTATLPVCAVKITNYYKEKKTVEKLLTSDTIEPERKDGANHEKFLRRRS